jgi:hypothetical protein
MTQRYLEDFAVGQIFRSRPSRLPSATSHSALIAGQVFTAIEMKTVFVPPVFEKTGKLLRVPSQPSLPERSGRCASCLQTTASAL